jgi:hypothetical protein
MNAVSVYEIKSKSSLAIMASNRYSGFEAELDDLSVDEVLTYLDDPNSIKENTDTVDVLQRILYQTETGKVYFDKQPTTEAGIELIKNYAEEI